MLAPIIKGLLLGLILSISLGPVIFAILKQSITNGRRAGYIFVAGVSTSDIGLLLIANIFTSIFLLVLDHKAFIAMAGAGFLLLLGLYTLFFKKIKIEYDEKGEEKVFRKRDYLGIYFSGFFLNFGDMLARSNDLKNAKVMGWLNPIPSPPSRHESAAAFRDQYRARRRRDGSQRCVDADLARCGGASVGGLGPCGTGCGFAPRTDQATCRAGRARRG